MSNRARAGVIAVAVVIVVVAFVVLRPGNDDKKRTAPASSTPVRGAKSAGPTRWRSPSRAGRPWVAPGTSRSPRATTCGWSCRPTSRPTRCTCTGTTSRRTLQEQARAVPVHGQGRRRLRAGEPHRRARGQEAADRPPGRRAFLMFVLAHGIVGRTDLPIPQWLFGWAAAVVLVVSFVALAVLWPKPRLTGRRGLPAAAGRALAGADQPGGGGRSAAPSASGLLFLVVYAGLSGEQVAMGNFASEFTLVIFWVGPGSGRSSFGRRLPDLQPVARDRPAGGLDRQPRHGGPDARAVRLPRRLGYCRRVGLLAFTWLDFVYSNGSQPNHVAGRHAGLLGDHLRGDGPLRSGGVELQRGEAFSVYFGLFARAVGVGHGATGGWGLRRPLAGLTEFEPLPGSVFLLAGDDRDDHLRRRGRGARVDEHLPAPGEPLQVAGGQPGDRAGGSRSSSAWWAGHHGIVYGFFRLGDPGGRRSVGGGKSPAGARSGPSCTRWSRSRRPT